MEVLEVLKIPKNPQNFCCNICHYYTSNKKDYSKHLLTPKHKNNENGSILEVMEVKKSPKIPKNPLIKYNCICGKIYKTHSGIWKHKQKCIIIHNDFEDTIKTQTNANDSEELIKYLMKENVELKNKLILNYFNKNM
jgi:spore coat polysaccharide biosynthesis protein SpsF (cytidylyltransferase family)